jgi:hypothetical protein
MKKKVEEAAIIARLGLEVVIAHAGSENGRLACLLGSKQISEINKGCCHHTDYNLQSWQGTIVKMKGW